MRIIFHYFRKYEVWIWFDIDHFPEIIGKYEKSKKVENSRSFTFPTRRRKKRLNFSGKSGFQSGIISPVFRKYETKSKALCPRQVRQKRREALFGQAWRLAFYSNSIVATGFSEISQRTRLTPGMVWMIRSRMVQSTGKGISGMVAVTASTVLTARMITAQPM